MTRGSLSGCGAAAIVTIAVSLIGCGSDGSSKKTATSSAPCRVGAARDLDTGSAEGNAAVARPFVVSCIGLAHAGRGELIAYRRGESIDRSSLCVNTVFSHQSSQTCRGTEAVRGLRFSVGDELKGRWLYFEGFAAPNLASAILSYPANGGTKKRKGVVTRVEDPALLDKLSLEEPFVFFSAEAPRGVPVDIVGRDRAGRLLFKRKTGILGKSGA